MKITEKKLTEIRPYPNNPRKNKNAVKAVENSIKEFGFKVPIVIDETGEIVAGHTRYEAAKRLGIETVPCVVADDLTDEQVQAYRLADNKTSELSEWDIEMLDVELEAIEIDMEKFGFFEIDGTIDSLYNDAMTKERVAADEFSITLIFPRIYELQIQNYISEYGKSTLVDMIIERTEI